MFSGKATSELDDDNDDCRQKNEADEDLLVRQEHWQLVAILWDDLSRWLLLTGESKLTHPHRGFSFTSKDIDCLVVYDDSSSRAIIGVAQVGNLNKGPVFELSCINFLVLDQEKSVAICRAICTLKGARNHSMASSLRQACSECQLRPNPSLEVKREEVAVFSAAILSTM